MDIFFSKKENKIVGNHGVKVSMTNFIAFLCYKFPQNGEFSPYNVKFLPKSQNPHNFTLNPHLKNSIPTTSPNIPTLGKIPHIWTHCFHFSHRDLHINWWTEGKPSYKKIKMWKLKRINAIETLKGSQIEIPRDGT